VKDRVPLTAIRHGKADTAVLYGTVEAFAGKMVAAGNHCGLEGYEG